MNERIMEAVREIEDIRDAMGKDYPWENIVGEMIERNQYFDDDDEPEECVPQERAIKDRAKMLEVLRRFYRTYAVDFEGMDDFVTLFGVYCNHYIRFNLHRAIPNEDGFGISALWDTVTDVKLQEYLCLLQQGIFKGFLEAVKGVFDGTNDFLNANILFPESYSLPNLYLFLCYTKAWLICKSDDKRDFEEKMVDCWEDMNCGLQDYCLGRSPFLRSVKIGGQNRNPLPYIKTGNLKEHKVAYLAKKMADAVSTLEKNWKIYQNEVVCGKRDFSDEETYEIMLDSSNLIEAKNGFYGIYDEEEGIEQNFVPDEWRDYDNVIFRIDFLSIPCFFEQNDIADLIDSFRKARKERAEKEAIQQEKDEIIQEFSHTYQNMTATALYQVAIALLSRTTEEDLALGRTALLEYTRKETLTKDVYMMKLKYENNTEKLRSILRQSCKFPSPEMHTIHEVVNQALLTALISAFYDEGQGNAVAMFDNLSVLWPSMEEIVLSFEKEVIQHEKDCLEWLQTKGIDLCMEESEQWMSIGFVPNGYAEVLLRNLITELFVNFFKYGDQKQKVLLSFQGDNSTYDSLHIRMENFLLNGKRGTSNSQVGLHAMSKMLRVLWDDREEKKRIVTDYVDDKFITRLWLPLAVFQQRGEEK